LLRLAVLWLLTLRLLALALLLLLLLLLPLRLDGTAGLAAAAATASASGPAAPWVVLASAAPPGALASLVTVSRARVGIPCCRVRHPSLSQRAWTWAWKKRKRREKKLHRVSNWR
jgi:hypothetical protein